jgi:hypothetical protein
MDTGPISEDACVIFTHVEDVGKTLLQMVEEFGERHASKLICGQSLGPEAAGEFASIVRHAKLLAEGVALLKPKLL